MARKIITGDAALEKTLRHLADKSADAVAKAALGGSLSVLKRAIKNAAPVGATGNLKASIGSRFEKGSRKNRGRVRAIAGVNVGKRTKAEKESGSRVRGPHAHLVALGTKARFRKTLGGKFAGITNPTKSQLSTGIVRANPFVKNAAGQCHAQMLASSQKRAAKALAREAVKAAKRTRSN